MRRNRRLWSWAVLSLTLFIPATTRAQRAEWNVPQKPFRIAANTWYVGTHGLSAILVTSPQGHVLIDGALPESAPLIEQNIRTLGFRVEDVKVILNSHDHYDHAGGIAELQRASGAEVRVMSPSVKVLEQGRSGSDDPQFGVLSDFPGVANVYALHDGDTVRVGPLALVAHATPGHTPGGTSWSWRSCAAGHCVDIAYVDSQTPVSADGFLYTSNTTYPAALADFTRGLATIESLPCGILLTPHPDASGFWERLAKRDAGDARALEDGDACRRFVANARARIAKRVADERSGALK